MFRDQQKHLARLEKELLQEEEQAKSQEELPVWEQEDWDPEDMQDTGRIRSVQPDLEPEEPEQYSRQVCGGKKKMPRLTKLTVTALCLLGAIALVLLYWVVRFF